MTSSLGYTRRDALAALGTTALVSGLALCSPARAKLAPFRRTIGSLEVNVVSDGVLNVPLSLALPDTPLSEVTGLYAAQGLSLNTPAQTNVTLVKSAGELVLIDAGSGSNFQPTAGELAENLEAAGIDVAAITKVVFTHGHADHLWGVIDDLDEERFPNATYVISSAEWDFWTGPNTLAAAPDWLKPMAQAAMRILRRLEPKIERRREGDTIAPGLTYVDTRGHTPGHMSVMIESGREQILVGGDALINPAVSFARPEWRMGSDFDGDRAVATRRQLLDRLATDRIPLIGFHLPWPGHGRVERAGTAYRYVPG